MTLKLYHGGPTANSLKTLFALNEKGVDYAEHRIDWEAFEQHSEAFKRINPRGQVPVLVHDGAVITESTVICLYVDEVFAGPGLQPETPLARARMRVWTKYVDEYFCWCVSTLGWHFYVASLIKGKSDVEFEEIVSRVPIREQKKKWLDARLGFDPAVLEEERERIRSGVARVEEELADRPWLVGDQFTLADIAVFSSAISSLPRLMPDALSEAQTPRTLEWMERIKARPALQAVYAAESADFLRRDLER